MVLALFIVGCAGGTAWALVFRTVSSPVGLREALRMYRREQTSKVIASLRNKTPVPGVYTTDQRGREPQSGGCGAPVPLEHVHDRRRRGLRNVSRVPITQHTEAMTVCNGPGGALSIPKLVTNESIAGSTTTSTVDCPATAYLYPPAVCPGQRWGATGVPASPAEKVLLTGQALGPATMVVGGHAVSVEHTRVTLTFIGSENGTNPTDFWFVPGNGLIVRERESVGVTQGERPLQREHGGHADGPHPGASTTALPPPSTVGRMTGGR